MWRVAALLVARSLSTLLCTLDKRFAQLVVCQAHLCELHARFLGYSATRQDFDVAVAHHSRTYASRNKSELHMLRFIQRQQVWSAVIELNEKIIQQNTEETNDYSSSALEDNGMVFRERNKLANRLPYSDSWCNFDDAGPLTPRMWGQHFCQTKSLSREMNCSHY